MTHSNGEDSALEDLNDIYATAPSHATPAIAKNNFEQWHHPRKQYVRIKQWCKAVQDLLRELRLPEDQPFTYLTLPGNELLDVRELHGVCDRAGVKLRYLGFNSVGRGSPEQIELNISQNEVRSLSTIHEFSYVEEDRIETLSNTRSSGWERLRHLGHCHAINLDLCTSLTHRGITEQGSILAALRALIEYQTRSTAPWLLFVTTKIEPGLIHDSVRAGFSSAINANTGVNREFRGMLSELVGEPPDTLDQLPPSAWMGNDSGFLKVFSLGLGKWLLRVLFNTEPVRKLELLSACYYRSGNNPNMVSLVFKCTAEPQPLGDRDGILPIVAQPDGPTEQALGLQLFTKVMSMHDLDTHLAENDDLSDRLIVQATNLMEKARYDRDEYQRWAREKINALKGLRAELNPA